MTIKRTQVVILVCSPCCAHQVIAEVGKPNARLLDPKEASTALDSNALVVLGWRDKASERPLYLVLNSAGSAAELGGWYAAKGCAGGDG
jgi:hypothetical protein